MQRKLVKHGSTTLTISLPSKWAKLNKLKEGQLLNLDATDNSLIITIKDQHFEKINVDFADDSDWYIGRILRHLYTAGYDELDINYTSKEQLKLIRNHLTFLTGLEIIESKPSFCRLKCTISIDESEYTELVVRAMWLLLAQFDYFIEDCKNGKIAMKEEVDHIFDTFAKLCNLGRRLINKKRIFDSTNSRYAYDFINGLMEISLYIKYSYVQLSKENKFSFHEDELGLIEKTRNMFYDLLIAYQNLDVKKVRKLIEYRSSMFDSVLEVLKKKNPIIMHYILIMIRNLTPISTHILMMNVQGFKG